MSRYNVNEEYDLENRREVTLTGFSSSALDDVLRSSGGNNNEPTLNGNSAGAHAITKDAKVVNLEVPENSSKSGILCSSGRSWLYQRIKSSFRRKLLFKRIPILAWLPHYRKEYVVSDLVAGITVGLTVIPQAIAYANVAGIPLQYGLYSSFMACFVYTIFGSCKDVPVGPTAIAAIMTRETLQRANLGPDFAVLLAFVSGCVSLLMGVLQLGFLLDFISGPVSVGFTSAASIIIATSQVKDILGLHVSSGKFVQVWQDIFKRIGETRLWDAALGIVCIIVLLLLRKVKDLPVIPKNTKVPSQLQRAIAKLLWLISSARNIIVVIICGIMAWLLEIHLGESPVILTGPVKQGLPEFRLPPFEAHVGNETYTFLDMLSSLGSGCLVIPMLSLLESISIAKVFSDGKSIDATQEMLALGACNVLSSFVSSMPVSGGLSRGAVNHSSGVKTTLGGVYTGLLVLISLQFLTPYLYYIPKASLAAVIITAVVFMVELHVVKPMWRTKKMDLILAIVTLLCCLFVRLELGIVIGIGINLLFLLYASARPTLRVHKATSVSGCEYLVITPDRSLVFPSVEYVRAVISKQGMREGTAVPVVIDSTHIQAADFTAAKGIKTLIEDFVRRGQPLIFHNLKPSVIQIFKGVKPSSLTCSSSELELNDCLKEYTNVSIETLNRY
ncbi:sodium-independent sulfate anion transporter [Harpegnathos saltator]|uniref:Sodium-independent sulfate anion transporter n=1 Tax=Harpegnathos saltator TaxID=610380 RepID=E2C4G5_HARSA|nr:sodium-independent sulfate anion transporter [Harpegnathos saltator]EFN77149.1 Sodium-independent sulfate anion transporter [Harpegnathos saltator]